MRVFTSCRDLLIGYWRRQDAKNLKKSGTEEQYTDKEQILQDLSDYARAVQYEPRIAPRSAGCAVRWKKPGTAHDASRTSRAAQERRASQICVAGENDGSPAAQLFLSVYDEELVLGPSAATSDNERNRMDGGQQQQSQVMSAQQEHPPSAHHYQSTTISASLQLGNRFCRPWVKEFEDYKVWGSSCSQ
ncbi:hypothetical protein V5799_024025 [Amblyomma americanum]|uniref:Uncharacterized protein n=1 Tax=Amblyomma americanum TaxID=6943 RepID=A0AAQ4EDU2_AMBAM